MKYLSGFLLTVLTLTLTASTAFAWSSGPPDGVAGNPPTNINCTFCHNSFPVNSGAGSVSIGGLPAIYTPGDTYTITVTVTDPLAMRWGFELTALDNLYNGAGTFTITNPVHTQLSDNLADSADYVKHTATGTYQGTTIAATWAFNWTAPAGGDVNFYVAGNGANNSLTPENDYIYTNSATLSESNLPNFVVDLTYVSGSPVPPGGGNITFDVYLANLSGQAQDFDAWLASEYEGGVPTTLVLRSFTNYLSGWAINRPGTFFPVPGGWAAGNYEFFGRCGYEPGTVWAEDSFPFVKSGVSDGLAFQPYPVDGAPNPFDNIDKTGAAAAEFALLGNYPNPFNPTTSISYSLSQADKVILSIYDLSGRRVATLVDGYRDAGVHDVTFDASGLASGVYIYRLTSNNQSRTSKMILTK